jgi:aryl-alcohol dehydrogenase-like predicted oxidoreductase
MEKRTFGKLGQISCLTLGGGGIGQVWGPTSRDEAVATVQQAVEAGITLLDLAPAYGKGEAELVVGAAFDCASPRGRARVDQADARQPTSPGGPSCLERSLDQSLAQRKLKRIDLFFSMVGLCQTLRPVGPRHTTQTLRRSGATGP